MRAFQREAEVTAGGAKFLVVEDDGAVARTIERVLQRHLPVVHAEGCREALRALDESVVGVVVDIGLPDGNGLDLASAAVGRYPPPAIVVLTGSENGDDANAAFRLGVGYLRKPCPLALLEQFAARAAIGRGVDDPRVRAALRRLALRRGLTPREMAIVFAAFDGAEHARLAAVAGLAVSTIKRQVHVLLGKVGGATLRDLVIELQRDALRAPTR